MAARGAIAPLQYRPSLTTRPHHLQPFVVAFGTYLGANCQSSNCSLLNNGLIESKSVRCPPSAGFFVPAVGAFCLAIDATYQSKDARFSDDEHIKDGLAQT